jgi:hypothetical protein
MASVVGRSRQALLAVAGAAAIAAGCGSEDEQAPAACLVPATAYLDALKAAPDQVLLDGSTPLSDCLVKDQEPAELGQVGESMVGAATRLNADARRDPSGAATVELGYLIGAVQQGASESGATESGGIHTDLLRRLDSAARFNQGGKPLPASFERAFGEGYQAGQQTG